MQSSCQGDLSLTIENTYLKFYISYFIFLQKLDTLISTKEKAPTSMINLFVFIIHS